MGTASAEAVYNELRKRKGSLNSSGPIVVCRCKRINGVERCDKGYSEHAFGNAADLMINGKAAQKPYVDELNKMKSQGFPVGLIIWAGSRSDHSDHIHMEGYPSLSKGQKPPCKGGPSIDNGAVNIPIITNPGYEPGTTPEGVPEVNIPLIGDIGPILFRAVWIIVALVAVVLTVWLVTQGLTQKALKSDIGKAALGAVVPG